MTSGQNFYCRSLYGFAHFKEFQFSEEFRTSEDRHEDEAGTSAGVATQGNRDMARSPRRFHTSADAETMADASSAPVPGRTTANSSPP